MISDIGFAGSRNASPKWTTQVTRDIFVNKSFAYVRENI